MSLARGTPLWIVVPWLIGALLWDLARLMELSSFLLVLAGLCFLLGLFLLWFFRDPQRKVASGLVCPADGALIDIEHDDGRLRFIIFMNPFNVHVNRSPLPGRVLSQEYHRGGFAPAYQTEAAENERLETRMDTPHGQMVVTQIAGVLVRRIVTYVKEDQRLEAGQRLGLIRFGSRVEVELPADGWTVDVAKGAKVLAGSTRLAHRSDEGDGDEQSSKEAAP